MNFEWDNNKNLINYQKHGLSFEDARIVFFNKTVTFRDDRQDYGEDRFITLGELEKRVVVLIHTQGNHITRIISMRKANAREQARYSKAIAAAYGERTEED